MIDPIPSQEKLALVPKKCISAKRALPASAMRLTPRQKAYQHQFKYSLSIIAICIAILTFVICWAGVLLSNRSFLACYTFLFWATFAFLLMFGYITYRLRRLDLESKVNAQWSHMFGTEVQILIKDTLKCGGYFACRRSHYARSMLPE